MRTNRRTLSVTFLVVFLPFFAFPTALALWAAFWLQDHLAKSALLPFAIAMSVVSMAMWLAAQTIWSARRSRAIDSRFLSGAGVTGIAIFCYMLGMWAATSINTWLVLAIFAVFAVAQCVVVPGVTRRYRSAQFEE